MTDGTATSTTRTRGPRLRGLAAVAGALARAADNLRSAVVHAAGCAEVDEKDLADLRSLHRETSEAAERYAEVSATD